MHNPTRDSLRAVRQAGMTLCVALGALASHAARGQTTRPDPGQPPPPGVSKMDSMPIPAAGSLRTPRGADRGADRGAELSATNATQESAQPSSPQMPSPKNSIGFDLSRMAIALVIVLGLILLAKWLVSRLFAGSRAPTASRAVKVLGRTSLAPRQQILLLQVGRRVIVVGESNGNLATLANIDDPDEVAGLVGQLQQEQIGRAASFGGLFGRAERTFDEESPDDGSSATPQASAATPDEAHVRSELSGLVDKVRSIRSSLGSDLDASR